MPAGTGCTTCAPVSRAHSMPATGCAEDAARAKQDMPQWHPNVMPHPATGMPVAVAVAVSTGCAGPEVALAGEAYADAIGIDAAWTGPIMTSPNQARSASALRLWNVRRRWSSIVNTATS